MMNFATFHCVELWQLMITLLTLCSVGTKAEDSGGHKGGDLSSLMMHFGQLVVMITQETLNNALIFIVWKAMIWKSSS